jgi:hypothetical protein
MGRESVRKTGGFPGECHCDGFRVGEGEVGVVVLDVVVDCGLRLGARMQGQIVRSRQSQ